MRNAECLRKKYKQLDAEFHLLVVKSLQKASKKTIHELRVNMKKQMALFRMIHLVDPHFSISQAQEALMPFYKNAGKLRTAQVKKTVLRKQLTLLGAPMDYIKYMGLKVTDAARAFREYEFELSLTPMRETFCRVESLFQHIPPAELTLRVKHYFEQLLSEIKTAIGGIETSEEPLHELRKLLKDLDFNATLADECTPGYAIRRATWQHLRRWEARIGSWHDLNIFNRKLEKHTTEFPELQRVRAVMQAQEASLLSEIRQQLPSLKILFSTMETEIEKAIFAERPETVQPLEPKSKKAHLSISQKTFREGLT
jgi:CHAD domain-containing protein